MAGLERARDQVGAGSIGRRAVKGFLSVRE